MAAMIPMAVFGLEVPPGGIPILGKNHIQSAFRLTMAAIDPSAEAEGEEGDTPRATLKIVRSSILDEDEYNSDEFDADEFEREMLNGGDEESDDDSEENDEAGPSDPAKSKKARKAAAEEAIAKLLEKEDMDLDSEDDDEEIPNGVNGVKKSLKALGKMPADDESASEDDEEIEIEEFVVCTLDPSKNYQQPLDITVGDDERVFFKVDGTHTIYLTGNYVVPAVDDSDDYDSNLEDEYDLEPDSDELDDYDEEDELDGLEDPRLVEIEEEDEDDEEAPALVKAIAKKADKKGKNKRPAEDDSDGLDEMIAETNAKGGVNGEQKLSKKQLKKLKKSDGSSTSTLTESNKSEPKALSDGSSANKKVQFAKNLEQGPTPTKDAPKTNEKAKSGQAALGIKTVQGVKIDDKKIGTGPASKNGDRVGMRYIGKLEKDGKVFDANKKGKPFTFKLGAGEVIKGWDIGIQGMSAGGERRITIPAHLAYGSKGAPPDIPGNANLVFDVKLLEISNKGK